MTPASIYLIVQFLSFFLCLDFCLHTRTYFWCRSCCRLWSHSMTYTHTLARSPVDDGSPLCRDLCLTAYNTHKKQTSMPKAGFKTAVPESRRPPPLKARPPGSTNFPIINHNSPRASLPLQYQSAGLSEGCW